MILELIYQHSMMTRKAWSRKKVGLRYRFGEVQVPATSIKFFDYLIGKSVGSSLRQVQRPIRWVRLVS